VRRFKLVIVERFPRVSAFLTQRLSLNKTLKPFSNGFCCQVGLVGVYNSQNSVAGTCVASTATAGYTTAVIVSLIIHFSSHRLYGASLEDQSHLVDLI
jgi:hypothetical protein